MPYTQDQIPFSGITPQSKHASRAGAEDAAARALPQTIRYLRALKDREPDGLTDLEAAALLGIDRTSVNARRVPLVKAGLVYASSQLRRGPTGVRNTVWRAS